MGHVAWNDDGEHHTDLWNILLFWISHRLDIAVDLQCKMFELKEEVAMLKIL